MQSMQRQFGRMLQKSPGDNAKVAVLLTDYEDVDRVLAKIIDAAKSWRDSWFSIASTQLGVVTEYDGLWDPIVGASEGLGRPPAPTPQAQLEQALHLKETYMELQAELVDEMKLIEVKVSRPASEAREYISPIRRTIKKRENKRLDYEKALEKVTKLQRKSGKTAKEETALAKFEADLSKATADFHAADAHLRDTLPPIVAATFDLIPLLIGAVVEIQNRLLALYYTSLHNYCQEHGFPSPPPPMEEVIAMWSAAYEPVRKEFESVSCIATGKAVRLPMKLPGYPRLQTQSRADPIPPTLMINGPQRSSSGLSSINGGPELLRQKRTPSTVSLSSQISLTHSPRQPKAIDFDPSFSNLAPTDFTTASRLGQQHSPALSPSSPIPNDYSLRSPSTASMKPSVTSSNGVTCSAPTPAAAVKKKAPPPPPPKRIGSNRLEEFVVAQYPFSGDGAGDLSFRQGDRIKIVKKTNTVDDWWVGEIGGVKGSFPANYCKAA
ncbi:SH3 domain-containing protein [Xylariaceae sp. FL0594]|nr:SH3 domain-containing protein [Xylariaceae sp. FL0594]